MSSGTNLVYLADGADLGTLTHELTHVWQFQTAFRSSLFFYGYVLGSEQGADLLHTKVSKRYFPGSVYRLPGLPLRRPFNRYTFNSQAEMVRQCYTGNPAYCAVTPYRP